MKNTLVDSHVWHDCNDEHCFVCRGGLAWCQVCGGAESSLPSMCPGRRMTGDEMDAVQAGQLNFTDSGWERIGP